MKSTDIFDDSSYHYPFLLHIAYDSADPSLALSFICRTEEEYEHLANNLKTVSFRSGLEFEVVATVDDNLTEFLLLALWLCNYIK